MVALDVTQTSKAIAIVGGYIIFVGLVSFFVKNRLFVSEALLALILGIIVGPLALDWFNPLEWTGSQENLNSLTFEITRIVIGIQVLFCGIALPKAYLWKERLSILMLIGPVMTCAWFSSSLLIWAFARELTFLESLVVGAAITPTDPVLANSICKGRFAEKHVPLHVRNIIVAESGANDGLGFPFLYMAVYLVLRHTQGIESHSIGWAVGQWFINIVVYDILLSTAIGALFGFLARKALKWAEKRELVDHDNFLAFGVGLAFFTLGVVGMLGSDDIFACFIAGNVFTWDDWFRVKTEDHAFQDVIDTLLNSAIFLYIGSILPWSSFGNFYGLTPWRLVILGILIMAVRRLPWVLACMKFIPTLPTLREATFAGFFGPIGVGAVYYVVVALQVLPAEREALVNLMMPIVFFMVLTSVVVHGITIPVGKTFSTTVRRYTSTRSVASGSDLVTRLPQAPQTLPKPDEEGMTDEHDAEDAAEDEANGETPENSVPMTPASKMSRRTDATIRFEEPTIDAPRPVYTPKMTPKHKVDGIMSVDSTPAQSRSGSPTRKRVEALVLPSHSKDSD